MEKYAVIVAGGKGTRMGNEIPKQFLLLKGKPVLWHTINAFAMAFADIKIVLVLPEAYLADGKQIEGEFPRIHIRIVAGGDTRFASVRNGLQLVKTDAVVFVHDGVRCLVTPGLIRRCYDETMVKGNAIPVIPATDTLRLITQEGNKPIDRNLVMMVQTPQTFMSNDIKAAFEQEYDSSFTDEASVAERSGVKINLVAGEESNIKITRPVDMLVAEQILGIN
ncbi:MAG TPA: 2-C-methyl-D-erythritol 4-phosphate cytidylyltransferase [Chitinophagaceae bacterium]|nr:2-C-methyl-D-erythritol 4-phosphate cytidylyltransferase [Chitinophagaceae bacterium]